MPTIHIPTALRPYTNNQASLSVEASTVGEAIRKLTEAFPKLHPHLFKEDGQLRSFVNLYLGDTDVRHLQGLDTPLAPDSELTIVPSVAGGVATVAESPIRSIIEDERLQAVSLSQEEVLRYSRHLIMPEVTMEGQRRLKEPRACCSSAQAGLARHLPSTWQLQAWARLGWSTSMWWTIPTSNAKSSTSPAMWDAPNCNRQLRKSTPSTRM